jgi:PPOX class probable F420-dependent enzyme
MTADEAREFIVAHHRAVLATQRADGQPQLSPVVCAVDAEGRVIISTRETAIKAKNVRRDPRVSLCVFTDGFYGPWAQVEGTAEVISLPDAMEFLVEYYRRVSGEHPDWPDYRAAMIRDQRVIIRFPITRAGPTISG